VRLYYEPAVAAGVLRALPAADVADEDGQTRVLRALDDDELPRAALVLTVPTFCPPCGGPLLEEESERFRCADCGERLSRAGQHWDPVPTTEQGIRIDELATAYERLFADIAGEPVEVDRSMLGLRDLCLVATFMSRAGADLIVIASKHLRGLALRKQRGRRVVFVPAATGGRTS
jgi:hypothetical protein